MVIQEWLFCLKRRVISTAHGRGLGARPEFPEKLRGVKGGCRPPNAGQRCIHALARGYISHPVLDMPTLTVDVGVDVLVYVTVGVAVHVAVSYSVHQARLHFFATETVSRSLGAFGRSKVED